MDKYKRYYGAVLFLFVAFVLVYGSYNLIGPKFTEMSSVDSQIEDKQNTLNQMQDKKRVVMNKIKKLQNSVTNSQKKIYAPVESDLGNDTLFFTLYNDVIEMMHANSIKIKSIDYNYNPKGDKFVQSGKDYFVCDVNVELVSNYTNLGKLIQELYQYPYYIKINELNVKPYSKDKKILISDLSLRLYAHTEPEDIPVTPNASMPNNEAALPDIQ